MADLAPPEVHTEDPGAHELEEPHHHQQTNSTPLPTGSIKDTPGGLPIPKTVVEKVEPDHPSHGEVPGTEAYAIRTQDATPDEVRTAPDITRTNLEEMPTISSDRHGDGEAAEQNDLNGAITMTGDEEIQDDEIVDATPHTEEPQSSEHEHEQEEEEEIEEVDEFDDFDDFAEGEEHDDDAFGDFDTASGEIFDAAIPEPTVETPSIKPSLYQPKLFSFDGLHSREDVHAALQKHIADVLPLPQLEASVAEVDISDINPSFLTERSQSLWAQLVAPPPLQPPDWIRSRIRRLFLVSLGVPVDLDEILPASKQKKLVLPSVNLENDRRPSLMPGEAAASGLVERIKESDGSTPAAADGSQASAAPKRRPGAELDLNTARLLCCTTDVAMHGFADGELQEHVARLTTFMESADQMLHHWTKQRDSATEDKKAFEEVINNLVKHAQKIRK